MTTPTAAEIAAMPDRKLDALLAELMGWTNVQLDAYVNYGSGRDACGKHPTRKEGGFYNADRYPVPRFSADHAAAAEAVAFLLARRDDYRTIEMEIKYYIADSWKVCMVPFALEAIENHGYAATEPRAKAEVCALALLAITKK